MFDTEEYSRRHEAFINALPSESVAILISAKECYRNNDAEYLFRQDSDFYYLTGYPEPEAIAVFCKEKNNKTQYIFFNREKDPDMERWVGPRIGQEKARKLYRADQAFPLLDFKKKLPELLSGKKCIYYSLGKNLDWDNEIIACMKELNRKARSGINTPDEVVDVATILHEMRIIKSPHEINLMRKAAQISAQAHKRAIKHCQPGLMEYQLEAELQYEFIRQGSRAPAYNSIVGGGANACVLHYTDNASVLREGDLVLVDAGAEYQTYASDITRTFPINGKFTAEQSAIYDIVLAAQLSVIELVKPGTPWNKLQEKAVEIISEGLISLGLLKGRLSEVLKNHGYQNFYMHNIGHWLGLDVHDVGHYKINNEWRSLQPGMVLTIEPGIYISSQSGVAKKWHNIGIRIEDDVLVTETGYEILSKDVPKHREEITALME